MPRTGLEPARLAALAPETSASTIPPPGLFHIFGAKISVFSEPCKLLCRFSFSMPLIASLLKSRSNVDGHKADATTQTIPKLGRNAYLLQLLIRSRDYIIENIFKGFLGCALGIWLKKLHGFFLKSTHGGVSIFYASVCFGKVN